MRGGEQSSSSEINSLFFTGTHAKCGAKQMQSKSERERREANAKLEIVSKSKSVIIGQV